MLTTSLTLNKEKWKPIWNKALVFLLLPRIFWMVLRVINI
ncbi:O-antigen ligase RfaL [Salmonella enterica subsp. enterica serovar Heidelberg str. RI-11-013374]|nr:O-antigen ligase RfaL [Salmonella enterica subsp. enterica serovar Heidelberg str. RI-11-013374]